MLHQPKLKFEEDKERTATRSPPKKSKVEQSVPKKKKLKLDADKAVEKSQHLRFGKAEITPDEASRMTKQQKRAMYAAAAARSAAHREVDQYEDDNVGTQALNEGLKSEEAASNFSKNRYIQRAIDFENSMNDLESQLYYRRLSPKEVAQQVLKATCQFYDADWCGLIQVDLDLSLWTPFWWFNTGATDKTMLLTEEYESAEFLDRWVQAVRKGIPMVVPDAEATKEAYPAEYDLYQRLGIRSVIAVSLEPRPVALLAVRNPKRYIQQTSMLRILAYVLLASYNEQKMLNRLQMAYIPTSIQSSKDIYVSLFGELSISTSKGVLKEADFSSPRISRLISYLLISRKNAISPQEITQTLWPDDSDNPAKNVKGLVYRLRQKFSLISDEPLILSSASGYQLNPKLHIMTDYQRFDELVSSAVRASSVINKVDILKNALDLYHGKVLSSADGEHLHHRQEPCPEFCRTPHPGRNEPGR